MTNSSSSELIMQNLMNQLYLAYKYFNRRLFNDVLPEVSISIGVKKGVSGLYKPAMFTPFQDKDTLDIPDIDEIMLNPTSFEQGELPVLSTLAHEMVHLYQQHFGSPGKNAYHNKAWGSAMKAVGLYPSDTGEPGGKETGFKVFHYVIEHGLFHSAASDFIAETGFNIEFVVIETFAPKTPRKVRYICTCDPSRPIWASNDQMEVSCNICDENFEVA